MENNEDKRQYTVIAAEIERQKTRKVKIERLCSICADNLLRNFYKGSIAELDEIINSLESLLPKERGMIVKSHESGQAYAIGSHKDFKQTHPNAEEYYSQFKPYDK